MIHTSEFWKNHFKENLKKQRVDWSVKPNISATEKVNILYSLQAWQLGETSDGSHLLKAATKHAKKENDPVYVDAVKLFIKEEQKHGNNLGLYIDAIREKRKKKNWGDTLFRKVRYFNTNMELWTITVLIVESAAQLFYQALYDATHCTLLKSICKDILQDEAHHIKFQNERMYQIFNKKGIYMKSLSFVAYSVLFFLVIHLVWWGHRKAFKAGGVHRQSFMQQMHYKFLNSMRFVYRTKKANPVALNVV